MKRLLTFLLLCVAPLFGQTTVTHAIGGVNYQTGTTYTFQGIDNTRLTSFSNASPIAVTLPPGNTPGGLFGIGSIFEAQNTGGGAVTITCSSCTINGAGTLVLAPGVGATILGDGSNYGALIGGSTGGSTTGINTQTANYQLAIIDAGGLVRMNVASANTVTIANDSTTNFPIGSSVTIRQVGAGQTTIVPAGGVTVTTPSSLLTRVQYATVQVIKVAANTWDLIGDTQ